jgi:hypothetical protein
LQRACRIAPNPASSEKLNRFNVVSRKKALAMQGCSFVPLIYLKLTKGGLGAFFLFSYVLSLSTLHPCITILEDTENIREFFNAGLEPTLHQPCIPASLENSISLEGKPT